MCTEVQQERGSECQEMKLVESINACRSNYSVTVVINQQTTLRTTTKVPNVNITLVNKLVYKQRASGHVRMMLTCHCRNVLPVTI